MSERLEGAARPDDDKAVGSRLLAARRSELMALACWLTAIGVVAGTVVFAAIEGGVHPAAWVGVPLATANLMLPRLNELSLAKRSLVLVTANTIIWLLLLFTSGWGPGVVAGYVGHLVIAVFLLGPRVLLPLSALALCAFASGAALVHLDWLAIDESRLDPSRMSNWVRDTMVFSVGAIAIAVLIRFAGNTVGRQYEQAARGLRAAERQRRAAARAKEFRIAAEGRLQHAQKLQIVGQLSSGLAHLLNNALTAIRGAVDELDESSPHEDLERASAVITRALEPATAAVRELMSLSREHEDDAGICDLRETVETSLEALRTTIGGDTAIDVVAVPGFVVRSPRQRLYQLVATLVLNAAEAVESGGSIRITIARDPASSNDVLIAVEDSGCGMAKGVLARALTPFFSTREPHLHPGLGLTSAIRIAEGLGGSLRLFSASGVGTRVEVRLPLVNPERTPATSAPPWPASALLGPPSPGGRQLAEAPAPIDVEQRSAAKDAASRAASTSDPESLPEPGSWREQTTRRLARQCVLVFAAAGAMAAVISAEARILAPVLAAVVCAICLLVAHSDRLGEPVRVGLFLSSVALGFAVGVPLYTLQGGGAMAGQLLVIAWAPLLGRRWMAVAAIFWVVAVLMASGWATSSGWIEPAQVTSAAEPLNWLHIGVAVAMIAWLLVQSVVSALEHADKAATILDEARERALRLRLEHEAEAARMTRLDRERRRSERAAMIGRAAGTIAHDLGNAMQALMCWAWEIELGGRAKDRREQLKELRLSVSYAEALASQFRVIDEDSAEDQSSRDASRIVHDTCEVLRTLLRDGQSLEVEARRDCFVKIGESDMRRLLFNLVANARDALDSDAGRIAVSIERDEQDVVLTVSDNGAGMTDETRMRLFDAFFTTKDATSGTGLGLYTVSNIVDSTSGTVEVVSQPGKGSTFVVRWPAAEPPPDRDKEATPAVEPVASESIRILLADDDDLVLSAMVRALELIGYEVVTAADGDEAFDAVVDGGPFDALCIDGLMPGRPTIDVIRSFVERQPDAPVLVCSGHLPEALAKHGLAIDGVGFLAKPFGPDRLRRELSRRLAGGTSNADGAPESSPALRQH